MSLVAGLLVFGVLFGLQPFELDKEPAAYRFKASLYFGVTTFLCTLIYLLGFSLLAPTYLDERRWNVAKEILHFGGLLMLIAIANTAVNAYLQHYPFKLSAVMPMATYTLAIGLAPITLATLLKQRSLVRKYAAEARKLAQQLELQHFEAAVIATNTITPPTALPPQAVPVNQHQPPAASIRLTIEGNNQGEKISFQPEDWVAAEASDNYCKIYLVENSVLKELLFRITLKQIESQLGAHPHLFKSHKSFLINWQHVQGISGNAQGYQLKLGDWGLQVPVSRSLNNLVKQRING
ncbi:MAG TPA: LytTR family DNA-binding domain-containing protein [Phnomibacter sp.]|nr:LytTR family DNA-binding domain-containing protein [Phnomibacter sp.]